VNNIIQARTVEKPESLVNPEPSPEFNPSRLDSARIEGPSIALGYMGEDKAHVKSVSRRALLKLTYVL